MERTTSARVASRRESRRTDFSRSNRTLESNPGKNDGIVASLVLWYRGAVLDETRDAFLALPTLQDFGLIERQRIPITIQGFSIRLFAPGETFSEG
jgi:hypothetical protein